ncbi:hypothetical protein B0H12DRAFT_101198 [Mycena haematopus]|nr:hypothetical protein B0H12DRAFT_101198 [Mycena haematopus]
MSLASFPEELLERILLHTVVAASAPHPRISWHPHSSQGKELQTRGRTSPLLVCQAFHRIALPLFYHTLVLHSPRQSVSLLHALRARPHLARSVRVLVLTTPSASDAEVLGMLPRLLVLDVTLPSCDPAITELEGPLRNLRSLQELRVRKGTGTYLSQPAPRAMLDALAKTIDMCAELHTATLSFPLSSDPSLTSISASLAAAPALRTLRTPLPALWTTAYVEVAANPCLESICLGGEESGPYSPSCASAVECGVSPFSAVDCGASSGEECAPSAKQERTTQRRFTSPSFFSYPRPRALLPTSLFLSATRPHARLSELIRAGTTIAVGGWRGRAATVGAC